LAHVAAFAAHHAPSAGNPVWRSGKHLETPRALS
jgi:hypothetical protein